MRLKGILIGIIGILIIGISIPCAFAGQKAEKPAVGEISISTVQAKVTAIDYKNRKVTLRRPDGEEVTIQLSKEARNLPQLKVGDVVTAKYMEAVTVEVFAPGEIRRGAASRAEMSRTKLGEKPGGMVVQEHSLVTVIEAIDRNNQLVTVRDAEGKSKTVKVENPENLKNVKVGDKVRITYTEAIGISVTGEK